MEVGKLKNEISLVNEAMKEEMSTIGETTISELTVSSSTDLRSVFISLMMTPNDIL